MTDHPADETAITKPSVVPGLGYPNHRDESSPEPIGWQQVSGTETEHVSRETSNRVDDE